MSPTESIALDDLDADLQQDPNSHGAVLRFSNRIGSPKSLVVAKLTRSHRKRLFGALILCARVASNHQDKYLDESLLECAVKLGNLDRSALKRLVGYRLDRGRKDYDTARLLILAHGNDPGPHRLELRRMIKSLRADDPASATHLEHLMGGLGVEPLEQETPPCVKQQRHPKTRSRS